MLAIMCTDLIVLCLHVETVLSKKMDCDELPGQIFLIEPYQQLQSRK